MSKSRFISTARGRDGGGSLRSGYDHAAASIRHEGVEGAIDVTGYLREGDGVPCVRVVAWDDAFLREGLGAKKRVLYDGPLAEGPGCQRPPRVVECVTGRVEVDPVKCACPECTDGAMSDSLYCDYCKGCGCSETVARCMGDDDAGT